MDLLIEKDDKRTYLSRYKVITTSFEESSPSVKRNNTQIQYRNGNVDFGGWNENKTIDYVGYYRADDLEDEEYLRERIYALLSDPEGYYITQLKNDNDDSFERPGETSGDYFDKQVNRPSHKRFYVYASSLESELVGSYGGHVLYKISATFTTMKLPYGESVPRDLDVKPNVPYYGRNLIHDTNFEQGLWKTAFGNPSFEITSDGNLKFTILDTTQSGVGVTAESLEMGTYTLTAKVRGHGPLQPYVMYLGIGNFDVYNYNGIPYPMINSDTDFVDIKYTFKLNFKDPAKQGGFAILTSDALGNWLEIKKDSLKLESGSSATDWSPAPEDSGYNEWYLDTYYNTNNLVIPYAGTVPCNQLEQGFAIEFTAKQSGSNLKISLNGTDFIAPGNVSSGDVFKLSGYEYLRNSISIVKATNKAYFKLLPGVTNKISSSIKGTIRILGYQDLYA